MARPKKRTPLYSRELKVRLTEEQYKDLETFAEVNEVKKADVLRLVLDVAACYIGQPFIEVTKKAAERVINPVASYQKMYDRLVDVRRELARQGGLIKKIYNEHPNEAHITREAWRNYINQFNVYGELAEEFRKLYLLANNKS